MEWNFLFRIDYLKEHGEERNLKGLLFTGDTMPPGPDEILAFLEGSGFRNMRIRDAERLVFEGGDPDNPVQIRIVKLGNEEEADGDRILRLLAEQFRNR
ncbi:hypothetical protein AB6A23_02510 [Paenibacillus tarimensis]